MNQNTANYRSSLQQMGQIPNPAPHQVGQPQTYANPTGHGMRPRMQQRYPAPASYPVYAYTPVPAPYYQAGTNLSAHQTVTLPQAPQQIVTHPGFYQVPQMYSMAQRQPAPGAHAGGYAYDGRQQPPQGTYSSNRVVAPHMNSAVSYPVHQAQHAHVPMAQAQPQPQQQPQAPQHQVQQAQQSQPQQQQIPVHQQSNQSQIQQQPQHVQSHAIPTQHFQRVDGPGQQQRGVLVPDQSQGQGGPHSMPGPGGNHGNKDTNTIRKKKILQIIDPSSGKDIFTSETNNATTTPEVSKDEEKKVAVTAASEPPEVSAAGIGTSSVTTSTTPTATSGSINPSDPTPVSNSNSIRESTPVLPGSTTDDSSSKTIKVKSEFFNKISQANDDNKKSKSDESAVNKVSEEVSAAPAVVATTSPPSATSNSVTVPLPVPVVPASSPTVSASASSNNTTPASVSSSDTATNVPPPTSTASTAAEEVKPASPELPAAVSVSAPVTASTTTTSPPSPDDDKQNKTEQVSVDVNAKVKNVVAESPTATATVPPSIEKPSKKNPNEKVASPAPVPVPANNPNPTPIANNVEETADLDEEIAKINNNKVENEKVLTNGIEKLDEEDQDIVPLSDSHELSTVSISPVPIEAYCGDNSLRSHDDSTVGESNLNEEIDEVTDKNAVVEDTTNVDVERENEANLEDGEIANDKDDDEEGDQNEENVTPKSILQYDRDVLIRIGKSASSKGKVEIQIADVVKDGKNNHMDKIGSYNQNRTPVNHQANQNYRRPKDPRNIGMGPIIHPGMRMGGGMGTWGPLAIPPTPPRGPARVIDLQTRVELSRAENAWKPTRTQRGGNSTDADLSADEKQTQAIVKQTRGILNKLTPENFDKLVDKFLKLELNDREDRISAVILVVFEKAIDEPSFSTAYARMVQHVCQHSQETAKKFRKEILDQCQKEFQKTNKDEVEIKDAELEIENAPADKREALKMELEEKKTQLRRRSLGNVRFIGELYKLQMLTPKIMVDCVHMLLGSQDEESLECLCKLLTTVGQKLDNQLKEIEHRVKIAKSDNRTATPKFIPDPHFMDNTFIKLRKLSNETSKLSSRIRFALLDVVELRENDWKPRRDSNAPKTIEEVRRDAIRQEQEEKRQINALPDVNMGQRRPSPMNQSGPMQQKKMGSDWNTVQSNKSSRFSQVKKPSESSNSPVLAPPVTLGWSGPPSRGSSSSSKNQLPPRFQQQLQNQQGQGQGGTQHSAGNRFGQSQNQNQSGQSSYGGNRFNALSSQSNSSGITLGPGGGGSTGGPPQLIQSTPQPAPQPPSQQPPQHEPYNTANIEETVKNIFQEYLSVKKFEDTLHWIKSRFPGSKVLDFIDTLARLVGEMSKENQQCGAGQLVKMLIKHKVVQRDEVLDVISKGVIVDLPDIQVDCPRATSYVAMFVLEIFGDESNLSWLIELSQPLKEEFEDSWSDIIGDTLNLFKLKRDKPYVKSLWNQTKDKDQLLIKSLPWLSDESVSSLVHKMIPVLEQNEREEIVNIFKEKSWDLRESEISSALLLAICEVSYGNNKWDISKLEAYLPLLSKPQGPDLWKIVKDQFLQKRGVGKDQEDLLWTRLLSSKLVDQRI